MTPLNIDPTLLLLVIAFLYILVFGGLSHMRREGLSAQFALEALLVTAVLVGGGRLIGVVMNPFLFIILLYVITMRSRILVDIANMLAQRGRHQPAFKLYDWALALRPDQSSRLIIACNRGAAELHSGHIDQAIKTLEGVLEEEKRPNLGLKYEAVCRCNLGLAYDREGERAKAVQQFNEVIDLFPGSPYARAAEATLKRWRSGQAEKPADE